MVSRGFSKSHGGAERVTVELASALESAGHELTVLAEKVDAGPGVINIKGTIIRVPVRRALNPLRALSFHKKAGALLGGLDVDIVFGLAPIYPLDVYRASGGVHAHWMRRRYPNPILRTLKYITTPENIAMAWIEQRLLGPDGLALVITNSRLVKTHVTDYHGIPADRVRVVRNGVDHELFNPGLKRFSGELRREHGVPDGAFVVLFVANNWKRKGLDLLLKAAADTGRAVTVLVVGRGSARRFRTLAERAGPGSPQVVFAGPTRHVERYYGAADVFALPTHYDPCANVCMEAMACALPVVTTPSNGAAEFIEHGRDGFVLQGADDRAGLKRCLVKLMDKTLAERVGRLAHEKMRQYTWQATMEATVRICEEAYEIKRGSGGAGGPVE